MIMDIITVTLFIALGIFCLACGFGCFSQPRF